MATQAEVGAHLGVTQSTVAELLRRKIIPRGTGRGSLDIDSCRLAYVAHLRQVAAGRLGDGDGELDLVAERARLAKEQADRLAMQNDLARGKVVLAAQVTATIIPMFHQIRNAYLELPVKMAPAPREDAGAARRICGLGKRDSRDPHRPCRRHAYRRCTGPVDDQPRVR